jgi:hypothetical protein
MHPGFCGDNTLDDPNFPYPNGQIAHNDGDFVGYDAGDASHGIAPQALSGTVWHDLMTYCDHQWVSRYTYAGIYTRLMLEDGLASGVPSSGGLNPLAHNMLAEGRLMPNQPSGIHVVARINQTKNTGGFRFVTPVAAIANDGQAPASESDYAIRVKREDETTTEYPAAFRRDIGGDPDDPNTSVTGSLDIIVPDGETAVALELVHNDTVLATYTPGLEAPEPENIQAAESPAGPTFGATASASPSERPKIVWSSSGGTGGPTVAALEIESNIKYTVQVSTDGGLSWRTIGVGLLTPEVTIDPHLLAGKDTIEVRVTATNGFKAKTTTRTLAIKDL